MTIPLQQTPPLTLEAATLAVRELGEVKILRDWYWITEIGYWVLHCSLQVKVRAGGPVPAQTNWYVLASPTYPRGPIVFFPAKTNGLKKVFRHQPYKSFGKTQRKLPWKTFFICLDTHVSILGLHDSNKEPYHYQDRLRWRFKRAIGWLWAASHGQLGKKGEPFELPFTVALYPAKAIFSENEASFQLWKDAPRSGYAKFYVLREKPLTLIVKQFATADGESVNTPPWGSMISDLPDHKESALWLRLDEMPVLPSWQVPKMWPQLLQVCKQQGIDLVQSIWPMLKKWEGSDPIPLMLGYPIPEKIEGPLKQYHWQLLYLPPVKPGYHRKGFRPLTGRKGYTVCGLQRDIAWGRSENWSPDQLGTRGQLAPEVVPQHIVQIGAGSLGSLLAESLLRGGQRRLSLVDGDIYVAGNLVRHTLNIDHIDQAKVEGLVERLKRVAPHAIVDGTPKHFQFLEKEELDRIACAQVILDCTGEDEVLRFLEEDAWSQPKRYISVSTGMNAKRLYIYTCYGRQFELDGFEVLLTPWLDLEREEFADQDLRWEGIGCYHPIVQARQDDLYIWAGIATKKIEEILLNDESEPQLWVWEQYEANGGATIRIASLPPKGGHMRPKRLRDEAQSAPSRGSVSTINTPQLRRLRHEEH